MKSVNILTKWDTCGMTAVEYDLFKKKGIKQNSITTITLKDLNEILVAKEMIPLPGDESEKVNIYFGFHHTSGHETKITCDDDGNCSFEVIHPEGIVSPAFWSEVIVFNYTGKDY